MKARSPFFARITRDILTIVESVPPGRVVTFRDIAGHLAVQPQQVAYILAMLEPPVSLAVPWHRAVPDDGVLSTPKSDGAGATQRDLLEREGFALDADGRIRDFDALRIEVAVLQHGIAVQSRPADAPLATARRQRGRPRER